MLNKGKQSIVVESEPPGATVYADGVALGPTPYTYAYDRSDGGPVALELRREGYAPVAMELRPKRKDLILFADAMLLGIPYIADANSNALYTFPGGTLKVNQYKAIPSGRQLLDLPVTVLESSVPAKGVAGRSGSRKLDLDSKELADLRYPQTATASILRGMADTYVDARSIRPSTPKGDEEARRAKVVLRPLLKGLDLQLEEKRHKAYGTAQLDIEWRFFSGIDKDSLLFSVPKQTTWPVYGASPRNVLADALQDAARQLMDEEGLYERISALRAAGLVRSKGEQITLRSPAPPSFPDRRSMIPTLVKGVVTVEVKDGHGSGFLITTDGYIMTNAHVVGTSATAKIRFEQGFTLEGQVVKVNPDFDVALIKVAGNDLPALSMGDDEALQLGEELFAIGTPLDEQLGQSVTRGIMSGKREIEGRKFIQTDVSINPGNSGGPLIDAEGKVVGVATMKIKAEGVQGIGFGVPISTALSMLNIEFTK